jgi:hypothetical protein
LPANIRLEWKCLAATNTLAYYNERVANVKKYITQAPGFKRSIKSCLFGAVTLVRTTFGKMTNSIMRLCMLGKIVALSEAYFTSCRV